MHLTNQAIKYNKILNQNKKYHFYKFGNEKGMREYIYKTSSKQNVSNLTI